MNLFFASNSLWTSHRYFCLRMFIIQCQHVAVRELKGHLFCLRDSLKLGGEWWIQMGHRDSVTNDRVRIMLAVPYVLYIEMSNREPGCWVLCLSRACFITAPWRARPLLLSTTGEGVGGFNVAFQKHSNDSNIYYSVREKNPPKCDKMRNSFKKCFE